MVTVKPSRYDFVRVGKGKNIMIETNRNTAEHQQMVKIPPRNTYELYNENYCPHCHTLLPMNGKCECGYETKYLVNEKEILTSREIRELRERLGTNERSKNPLDKIQKEIDKLLAKQADLIKRRAKI